SLQRPIAIPATSKALGSPFLRAYPPALEAYGISAPTWLKFLDELNRAIVVSPPLAVLGFAGDIVGLIPLHTVQLVGSSVGAAAKLSASMTSKSRSALMLRDANQEMFAPRSLRIDIVKLEVVANEVGIPVLNAKGKTDKHKPFLAPISHTGPECTIQQRLLAALAPYTSTLELYPDEHRDELHNPFSEMHAATSEWQRKKEEKKILKKREKKVAATEEGGKENKKLSKDFDKDMAKIARKEDKWRNKNNTDPEKVERELAKLEVQRERLKREHDADREKLEKGDLRPKKDKEQNATRKILWLFIR
ncbi:hypothetical protein FB567DRAFT_416264, partial [Paraphoma chrysanthemicola]